MSDTAIDTWETPTTGTGSTIRSMTEQPSTPTYRFDPELAEFAALAPPAAPADPVAMRERIGTLLPDPGGVDTSTLTVEDRTIPGPAGSPDVAVRVYLPDGRSAPSPGVLYIHGGGFVTGSIDSEHAAATAVARNLRAVVVSVEYRLAPEDPYPAGIEDCYAALQWLHGHAAELGVDTERIAVLGQSAGGGLAAGLALLARDRGGPALCFQYLGIPELDDRLETTSMRAFVDTPMWARPAAIRSWEWYLGDLHGGDVPTYAAPARATDLAGLPPAYVSVMEFDPLRDEGVVYALRMMEAGVSVELHAFPGTFHGSGIVTTAAVSKRASAEMFTVLSRALGLS